MKAVILAGGVGSRLAEETTFRPKPMVEVGGKPILWHILKIYSSYGINDFIICLGYKGYIIKEYFANYFLHMSDVTFDMQCNRMEVHHHHVEPWKVTLVDTGDNTATGGRIKRVGSYLDAEDFCFTYGDGLTDLNVHDLIDFHQARGTLATVTAAQPRGRFGALELQGERVVSFREKPEAEAYINAGFFILSPKILDYIKGDQTAWEDDPVERLASEGQLSAYIHKGFWQPMDTLREKNYLENLWVSGSAPWKIWT